MNTRIQFEVGTSKTDTEVFHLILDDDEVVASVDGAAEAPDFVMILAPEAFAEVVGGELGLDVGYMQGRVKVTGNVGRMLSVLPVLTSAELLTELSAHAP
ncbi:MAG: SCP2 sterol-binding domain-containing protein [Acidimicrobiales bacterium]|nr:SCP2 sterol-binding domain-containing protein [Acidimicrobiales bacterium]